MSLKLETWGVDNEERGGYRQYGQYLDDQNREAFPGLMFLVDHSFKTSPEGRFVFAVHGNRRDDVILLDLVTAQMHELSYLGLFSFNYNFASEFSAEIKFSISTQMVNDAMGPRFPWFPDNFHKLHFVMDPRDPSSFPFTEITKETIFSLMKNPSYKKTLEILFSLDELNKTNLWLAFRENNKDLEVVFSCDNEEDRRHFDSGASLYSPNFLKPMSLRSRNFKEIKAMVYR